MLLKYTPVFQFNIKYVYKLNPAENLALLLQSLCLRYWNMKWCPCSYTSYLYLVPYWLFLLGWAFILECMPKQSAWGPFDSFCGKNNANPNEWGMNHTFHYSFIFSFYFLLQQYSSFPKPLPRVHILFPIMPCLILGHSEVKWWYWRMTFSEWQCLDVLGGRGKWQLLWLSKCSATAGCSKQKRKNRRKRHGNE